VAWMTHPNLPGHETEVPDSAVTIMSHSGWLLMDGPPEKPVPAPVGRATVTGEPYSADDKPSSSDDDESGTEKKPTSSAAAKTSSKGASK
jgi:hypothetical protein